MPLGGAKNTLVSIYEIPPKKAAYPYHFHHNNEETFYIISGEGILRTPIGERKVSAGEVHDVDITVYPDSDKIGVWGMGINKLYPQAGDVDYYDGE